MMKYISFLFLLAVISACGGEKSTEDSSESPQSMVADSKSESPASEESWQSNKGVGPVTEIVFDQQINQEMAEEGKGLYNIYCLACHKVDEDYIGPSPKGIFNRRTPEWVANMIVNPEEMLSKDPMAKELLVEYNNVPMASMGLDQDQARKIVEYFRTIK